MEQVHEIAIDQLRESPFNPRRTFLAIDELAADIKALGYVHSPLRVRPILPNPLRDDIVDGYEIVFGHRRFRAAQVAGLNTLPCIVDRMNDAEARRLQISENLQRKDVHPIEEAEGFQALIDDGVSADQIAADNGKSRSYVYGRLKLLQAVPQVRDACVAGEIGSEVALLIARLRTPKLQEKALAAIKNDTSTAASMTDGGARSFRHIRDLLAEKFTLELKGAIFDPEDASLVAEAGACSACPKRTGNAPEFEDLAAKQREGEHRGYTRHGGPDVCTDPECFELKKKAHLKAAAEKLQADGKTVIDGNKARAAIGARGEVKGGFIELKDVKAAIKKAKADIAVVHIQNQRDGKVVQAVRAADLEAAGLRQKEAQGGKKAGSGGPARDYDAEHRQKRELQPKIRARNLSLLHRVRAARPAAPSIFELKMVATCLLDLVYDSDDGDVIRELWPALESLDRQEFIDSLSLPDLTAFVLDCTIVDGVSPGWWDIDERKWPGDLVRAAEEYMVPLDEPDAAEQLTAADEIDQAEEAEA